MTTRARTLTMRTGRMRTLRMRTMRTTMLAAGRPAAGTARRVTAGAAAMVTVLGAALSGCGTAGAVKMGAAATVGDQRIPTARVEAAAKEWREQARRRGITDQQLRRAAPQLAQYMVDPASAERSVLFQLISFELVDEVARSARVTVTPGQIDQEIRRRGARQIDFTSFVSAVPPSMQREWVAGDLRIREVVRRNGVTDEERGRTLVQRLVAETARRVGVRVNPRYGSYDQRLHFLTPQCTDLSKGTWERPRPARPEGARPDQQVPPPEFGGPRPGCHPLTQPTTGQP
jgi:hypothetical protein